jgi:hypothetical protein
MKNCPQCGQPRQGEAFKCPSCQVFYSQLDEILYAEQQRLEKDTLTGRLKIILAAPDRKQALKQQLGEIWRATPLKTKITFISILAFLFALIIP